MRTEENSENRMKNLKILIMKRVYWKDRFFPKNLKRHDQKQRKPKHVLKKKRRNSIFLQEIWEMTIGNSEEK